MTYEEIISETAERLGLASDEAKSRIRREVDSRYRRATSSIGLETSRRAQISKAATIGNRTITFGTVGTAPQVAGATAPAPIEKVLAVIDKTSTRDLVLRQVTMDDMHDLPVRTVMPRHWAVASMHTGSVDVYLDTVPATTFTLYADVILGMPAGLTTLTNQTPSPDFPESFHELIIFGVMADEYRRMEKMALAQSCELDYEKRLSDLRMFIAKTAYMDQYQGRSRNSGYRWLTGYTQWDY